jgi:hypothetical protein
LWGQMVPMVSRLDLAQTDLLLEVGFVNQPELGEHIQRYQEEVSKVYGNKPALAKHLLGLFKKTPSHENAKRLAAWVAALGLPRVLLTNKSVLDGVSEDYIQILETHFGGEKATLSNLRTTQ